MPKIPNKRARQRFKQYFNGDPNAPESCEITVDPRVGIGVPAQIGSLGVRNINDSDAELYQKWGLLDTQWRLISGSGTSNARIVCIEFDITDWISSDGGDLYQIIIEHGLNTECLNMQVFDELKNHVLLHNLRIVNANRISLKVSQSEVDCRFTGSITIISLL